MPPTERRCVGPCCDNRPGWEWVEDPVTKVREKRRQAPQPGQHGTDGHECVPRLAQDGAYLCRGCTHWLTDIITTLPSYADDLERAATHTGGTTGTTRDNPKTTDDWGRTGQGAKSGEASPDFALQRWRVQALHQLAHDTAWWATHVTDERGLHTLPPLDTVNQPRTSVHKAVRFLRRHADWLTSRPDADQTLDAFRAMRYDAAHAMDLPRDRSRFPVGPCPEDGCDGTVNAYIGTQSADSALGCDHTDQHQWAPHQFYRAGIRIKRRMDEIA